MRRVLLFAVIGPAALLCFSLPSGSQPALPVADDDEANLMSINAACYVCHIPFVKEELSRVHLEAKVACIKCHGLSAAHANDEDVGATKPDTVYPRDRIDASCRECHERHDVPAAAVVARFLKRKLSPKTPAVCTDCHGTHKIERPEENV